MNSHLSLAPLFLLLLVGRSLATARFDPPAGSCSVDWPCKEGYCCSKWGFCGTTEAYCSKENCDSQCPDDQPNPPEGSCSQDRPCKEGYCCSKWGWCGTTEAYCSEENCEFQCPTLKVNHFLATSGSEPPVGSCTADRPCNEGYCCSKWGWCGNTEAYCSKENCAFQCPDDQPNPPEGSCSQDRLCKEGYCCSKWGWCGTTEAYCGEDNCAFQCPTKNFLKAIT